MTSGLPALSALLLPSHISEKETITVRFLHNVYSSVIHFAIGHRVVILAGAVLLLVFSGLSVRMLGLEFLPKLEEGNLWIRATMPSTISLDEGNPYVNRMRRIIASTPEVISVVSQHGRPDDGTDAAGFFNAEFFAPLKPRDQWRTSLGDKDDLTEEILSKLQAEFPGVEFNFSQYLQDNVAEAVSGVKGENSIKLYGNDLKVTSEIAKKIKSVLSTVQGITDLAVFTSLGQPTVQVDIETGAAKQVLTMPVVALGERGKDGRFTHPVVEYAGMLVFDANLQIIDDLKTVTQGGVGGSVTPGTVLFRRARARYVDDGHAHRVVVDGGVRPLRGLIWHDDRKPLSHWVRAQDRYAKQEAEKLMAHRDEGLSFNDRVRKTIVLGPPAAFLYTLLVKGVCLDGWAGWHYAFQRALAETLLSLRLIETKWAARVAQVPNSISPPGGE